MSTEMLSWALFSDSLLEIQEMKKEAGNDISSEKEDMLRKYDLVISELLKLRERASKL